MIHFLPSGLTSTPLRVPTAMPCRPKPKQRASGLVSPAEASNQVLPPSSLRDTPFWSRPAKAGWGWRASKPTVQARVPLSEVASQLVPPSPLR